MIEVMQDIASKMNKLQRELSPLIDVTSREH